MSNIKNASPLKTVRKIVVTFDICSSTSIIEDLHKTENITKWKEFLVWIDDYLKSMSEEMGFIIYKFTGDGWLILFDYDFPGEDLINFLHDFCNQFKMRYQRKIDAFLEASPKIAGLTFGIDRGSIIEFKINNQIEYVGRPINVACRLQGAIKDNDKTPQYKALISMHFYQDFRNKINNFKRLTAQRKLRNISGGEMIKCLKVELLNKINSK